MRTPEVCDWREYHGDLGDWFQTADPVKSEAAALIRRHLWQPRPPGPTGDGRPWTMARELEIWSKLTQHRSPEEVNGAIQHVRAVTGATGPIRLTWFIRRGRGPQLFARAVAAWQASLSPFTPVTRGGGLGRLVVELPPAPTSEVYHV